LYAQDVDAVFFGTEPEAQVFGAATGGGGGGAELGLDGGCSKVFMQTP